MRTCDLFQSQMFNKMTEFTHELCNTLLRYEYSDVLCIWESQHCTAYCFKSTLLPVIQCRQDKIEILQLWCQQLALLITEGLFRCLNTTLTTRTISNVNIACNHQLTQCLLQLINNLVNKFESQIIVIKIFKYYLQIIRIVTVNSKFD